MLMAAMYIVGVINIDHARWQIPVGPRVSVYMVGPHIQGPGVGGRGQMGRGSPPVHRGTFPLP